MVGYSGHSIYSTRHMYHRACVYVCTLLHTCSPERLCVCVWLCFSCIRAYVSLYQHRAVSFEVCLPCRSLAENTGMAICDTIDTWHVNIDNNSVIKPPAGLPFLTFIGFGGRHNAPSVHSNLLFLSTFTAFIFTLNVGS